MGGKWTIQRLMAEDTVDSVYENLLDRHLITPEAVQKSISKKLKLVGSFEAPFEYKTLPDHE